MKEKRTKILYVVSTLRQSGPTNQLKGIISNLDKSKYEAQVLTLSPEPKNTRLNDFTHLGIEVASLNLSRVQFQIKGKQLLKIYMDKLNPDIIHTSGVRADTVVSKLNVSSKHCMTIRNYVYDDYVAKFGSVVGKIAAESNIKAMQRCKYVICCSKSLKDMYMKILSQNLYVVQNGVDTKKFKPVEDIESKHSLRDSLNLPRDKVIFIAIGSLIKRKDPVTIIEAFKAVNIENKAVLILLGDGDLMNQCMNVSNNNILLKGNVDNVNDFLKASDVYVSASESEGLPNSVLEAGRCGVNLILSNIPQHLEVFENNLDFISLFNVGDTEKLTEAMEKEIRGFSNEINYDLSNYIEENFSNEVMSRKYEKIYMQLVQGDQL
ncbi:MAG TPA: group 1 glycosyl transferase [Clostridiales bacterium]|nr:group 1 glycosyl transferase [Clostridiales bacterium]